MRSLDCEQEKHITSHLGIVHFSCFFAMFVLTDIVLFLLV